MPKFKSQVTKKWITFAAINILILTVVFGLLILVYGYFASNHALITSEKVVKEYAERLSTLDKEQILKIIDNNSGELISIDEFRQDCYIGLYDFQTINDAKFISNNAWLNNIRPAINVSTSFGREKIGDKQFMTCHKKIENKAPAPDEDTDKTNASDKTNAYVKVFMSLETIDDSREAHVINNVIAIIIFIVFAIAVSVILAYLEVRPLAKNYEEQRRFINDISHEIRTPLTVIKGNVENIMARPEATVKEVNEDLYTLINEVEYMNEMTSGMLTIVRNSNKANNTKDTNVSDIVRNVIEIYGELSSVSQRALIASIDNVNMRASREKIKQLLMILLDNALKYTKEGDKIIVNLKATAKGCLLTVSDTGIGVTDEDLGMIFERFYRAKNAQDYEGTGLGLSIAKSIVDSYNGTIEARHNIPSGLIISAELMAEN